jgi:hypothetical protein
MNVRTNTCQGPPNNHSFMAERCTFGRILKRYRTVVASIISLPSVTRIRNHHRSKTAIKCYFFIIILYYCYYYYYYYQYYYCYSVLRSQRLRFAQSGNGVLDPVPSSGHNKKTTEISVADPDLVGSGPFFAGSGIVVPNLAVNNYSYCI